MLLMIDLIMKWQALGPIPSNHFVLSVYILRSNVRNVMFSIVFLVCGCLSVVRLWLVEVTKIMPVKCCELVAQGRQHVDYKKAKYYDGNSNILSR